MIRTALLVLLTLVVAVLGGAASVWYVLLPEEGIGSVAVGGWAAQPLMGTPDADPYTKARIARQGVLALGRAEGMPFIALTDSAGTPLRAECEYTVEGKVPPSRFWTLFPVDRSMRSLASDPTRRAAISSLELVRAADDAVTIAVGPRPRPGNWMAVRAEGPMAFVLTLYDAPIAGNADFAGLEMPQVIRMRCDA